MASSSSNSAGSVSQPASSPIDPIAQINTYRSYVSMLTDPGSRDENKLKAVQALSEELESIILSPHYPAFLEHSIKIFLKFLIEGSPVNIAEYNIQQLRKLVLEMIHRLPCNDHLKTYLRPILHVVFKLVETENEENVMVCMHIITELHKQFRPAYSNDIPTFLEFVKVMYKNLPKHVEKIFEPRNPLKVNDLQELNVEALLGEIYTVTPVHTDKKTPEGSQLIFSIVPKGTQSLKVLTELPILYVLMLQLYKDQVYQDVADFIPLIMDTITLEPQAIQRDGDTFNKEAFVDLIGAQIKMLSFLAYIIKTFVDKVSQYSSKLVKGMLNLLRLCPSEVASLRRELLIATKHILALDLRTKFVPHIDLLFDENMLFGKGFTAHETLRPLAYSTLADLVHHVRTQLEMPALSKAIHLFSKNIHDETLPTSIQTMSCKLLLNLVDCVRSKTSDSGSDINGQDLLIRMLHVFVNKFKSIAQLQLPVLKAKQAANVSEDKVGITGTVATAASALGIEAEKCDNTVKTYPSFPNTSQNFSIIDWRALVKTLVTGVKTITWGCASCGVPRDQNTAPKPLHPKETLVFIRFVKWALQALDIYALSASGQLPQQAVVPSLRIPQTVRSKEEKEVLEHFAGVFIMMNNQTFKEIFTSCIEYMVECIHQNAALQVVANSFLARPETSPTFATILVEYLLKHMEEMGAQTERASLYLKLFKLVFGSVSILASENEQMLKPYLHQIVNQSMELAMTARDPYNYFLLLRALFRSIGGGNHDILYQEFLPLLPNLLQGLNSLQSGLHKQHMKDLFVELCLTVPVRLSSLLPYLPMLMDPLVSALNGSQTLISQGLRTLELCVDNLQPDFLYEHIQPVRAELMQALWKTMRNPSEHISQVTFRVLGKFGGGNRKMMTEPQKLEYRQQDSYTTVVNITFPDQPTTRVSLPVQRIIEAAFTALKISTTEPWYRTQCWEVIRSFLLGSIQFEADKAVIYRLFTDPSFKEDRIQFTAGDYYICPDEQARNVHKTAFTAMFVAAAIKDLRMQTLPAMVAMVRHYAMVAIAQQTGPFNMHGKWSDTRGMDPLVMIDAIAIIMGHEEKELCKPGHLALVLILNVASDILGSKERACQLPLMEYICDKMCALCYESAWYAKLGGCIAIRLLFENMALKWVLEHQYTFLKALLYVMMDLTDEVSTGAVEKAKNNMDRMLRICALPLEGVNNTEEMKEVQMRSLHNVTRELVRQVTTPNTNVRNQATLSLQLISTLTEVGLSDVISPHKEVLIDCIPPKKHLTLRHQPPNIQVGLMEGNTFCHSLEPKLFPLDMENPDHKNYFNDLHQLVEKDESNLARYCSYKNVTNIIPLKKAALKAITACIYVMVRESEKLFTTICKVLNTSTNAELQQTAFECLQKFQSTCSISRETVHVLARPLLTQFFNLKNISPQTLQRMSYFSQLFPSTFHEKLCDHLLSYLKQVTEHCILAIRQKPNAPRQELIDIKIYSGIVNLYHQLPAATSRFVESLCKRVLHTEQILLIEAASPLRQPLMKYCLRFPAETVQLFLSDTYAREEQWGRLLEHFVRHADGEPFRAQLYNSHERLLTMVVGASKEPIPPPAASGAVSEKPQQIYIAVRMCYLITRQNPDWIDAHSHLVVALQNIWNSDEFQTRCRNGEQTDFTHWKLPRMIVSILLTYFKHNTNEVRLLFSLLRAFVGRYILEYHFLKEFLEKSVAGGYTVVWKRTAFFHFYELFEDPQLSQEFKACILRFVIIPCFHVCLDRGEGETLIGYSPAPDDDQSDNIVSVIINNIIDPDEPFKHVDPLRILLLQLTSLLVEKASAHIHDAANKRQGVKLRRLMTYAWPCLLSKSCVDPTTKYHGHLLLSHIIAKFAIHKRIVLQVFHSLLKAHAVEARAVVRQALEILTPAMPVRMEDGNTMLTHWTKKILVEEGHSIGQLFHILTLVVKHASVYYPVRHHLMSNISQAMQKLGFSPSVNLDQRRLGVDLAEICIKWEERRVAEEVNDDDDNQSVTATGAVKRSITPDATESSNKRSRLSSTGSSRAEDSAKSPKGTAESNKPIDKCYVDNIVYFLVRLACQVSESAPVPGTVPPGEAVSKRAVALLKRALEPDIWPNAEPKLQWMDKFFLTLESAQPNLNNISVGLDLLTYLITTLRKELILPAIKSMTKGLLACITYPNQRIIKLSHSLVAKLMATFPTDPANPTLSSKQEELEELYSKIAKIIYEGLANFDRTPTAAPSSLYGTLMMLKAACQSNSAYIDRLISIFIKVLQRITRDHLSPHSNDNSTLLSELLIICLDIVKNRVGIMGSEMRKLLIGQILAILTEKTTDVKVIKAVTKIADEWIRTTDWPADAGEPPSLREKSLLLTKLMQAVDKRFSDDAELMTLFLELILFTYKHPVLKTSELVNKLEPAFLSGLRSTQPHLREKFAKLFNENMPVKMYDRLLYICCAQSWDHIGPHYWIKQCIEVILSCATECTPLQQDQSIVLPAISAVIDWADPLQRADFANKLSTFDDFDEFLSESSADKEMDIDLEIPPVSVEGQPTTDKNNSQADPLEKLKTLMSNQAKFTKTIPEGKFLVAVAQLCHMDTSLAEWLWLQLFPNLWKSLKSSQHAALQKQIAPFLCSSMHLPQKECHPSALNTFTDAVTQCEPAIDIMPCIMKYLGKSHNLWHIMLLKMEGVAYSNGIATMSRSNKRDAQDPLDQVPTIHPVQDAIDSLSEMYRLMGEEDLWASVWQHAAYFQETKLAVTYQQHGFMDQASSAYQLCMQKYTDECAVKPVPVRVNHEVSMWEPLWLKCTKELNQWPAVLAFGSHEVTSIPMLVLESAWHEPNWAVMKDALAHIEHTYPRETAWKVNLYRGYLAICNPDMRHLGHVEKLVEMASTLCIKEWKRLPHIVSHIHLQYLQAAQMIMELQEACQIHQGLLQGRANAVHDMKAIVKTWRNRLPILSDDLRHWSDVFSWRQHHYQAIVDHYNDITEHPSRGQGQSMLGVHASAQAIIHFGKIARKHNLTNVCLDSLSKIHTIQSVPIVDCFQKIRQQVKCYHQMSIANNMSKAELQEGLEVIESTNLKFFTKEMVAEFYALKGCFLSQLGRTEDANKALSASVQLHDSLVKGWGCWGDYMEHLFIRDPEVMHLGESAIICYTHACRHQNETKSRKYLAKIFFLLNYDDADGTLSGTLESYAVGVPAIQWLPWIPQLLTCLIRPEGKVTINLLHQVGRTYAQAVYLPIRTLYLTLRIEQRGRVRRGAEAAPAAASGVQQGSTTQAAQAAAATPAPSLDGPIRATEAMRRCSRVLQLQRDSHPTTLVSLEGIAEQMLWFRESWYEEVVRQLRQALAKCYAIAFENATTVADAFVTPHTQSFVKKLVATFGIGYGNPPTTCESLKRQQTTAHDPIFQRYKSQITSDLDFTQPGATKLHNLIHKLKKWIKILEAKINTLPKEFLIDEKCRFLRNFTLQTAEVELPGEFLLPKQSNYYIRIARFLPKVDIVQKHGTFSRRIYIRGHNGRIYAFLIVSDSSLTDGSREERVLQLLRMMNNFFVKQKETNKRLVNLHVAKVVAISPQMRLVEDKISSLSLLDIYKKRCAKKGMQPDAPINRYYERLATVQAKGSQASHQVLRDIFREVQNTMVPRTMLKDWAHLTFPNATNYWTFRKMIINQLAVLGLMEYALHLTRMYPEMMYIHQDSGLINVAYFKFNIDEAKGELDGNWPVPFRLTPNLCEVATHLGVHGPLTAAMVASARCLATPSLKASALLRAILRCEVIAWHKRREVGIVDISQQGLSRIEGDALATRVNKAVTTIMARIHTLATLDGAENKVSQLVRAVNCVDNLCRMDPAWHPWL